VYEITDNQESADSNIIEQSLIKFYFIFHRYWR